MTKTLITAALPYANGPVHIGHVAGVYLPSDIYARFLRNQGKEVLFVSGTDEHGVPITIKAAKENKTPQEVVDENHEIIAKSFWELGISFDIFSRTTNKMHFDTAQEYFKDLYDQGLFIEQETEQYYDEEHKKFLADRYIVGTCPKCQNPDAYGDQCENCGTTLSPTELIDPRSALSGNKPIKKITKNWYLPLDKIQRDFLDQWINAQTHWKNQVQGQCRSWLADGLRPRAMTRDLEWGIPVPVPNADGKVLYVWFEAPIGYISATKEKRPHDWESWWKGTDTELVHFIGKDNIVFHCIIFPAMLHAHSQNYILPHNVPANEFLNLEGNKISTSKNWAVWLHEYLLDFPEKQDELRYVLASIMPENKDSEFTWADYQARVNGELVAILGNFVNRTMVLTHKYYEGEVPAMPANELSDEIAAARQQIKDCHTKMCQSLSQYKFRDGLSALMDAARVGNKFLADIEPWKLIKTNEVATQAAMAFAIEITHYLALACEPFLPFTHQKLCTQLNYIPFEMDIQHFWNGTKIWGILPQNHTVGESQLLYGKIEDADINAQKEKLSQSKTGFKMKEEIQFDEFSKMQIVVATITAAAAVPKADKLLQISLEVAGSHKTVLSGIAEHHKPEDIVGKQVCYLANLAPRKMRGIMSEGMILMAQDVEGNLVFVSPEKAVNSGADVA
jgi:methionyl-tRNA synthetase